MECPVCQKEFDEKTGRRPKKFCSDACKVKFWNAERKIKAIFDDPKVKQAVKESVANTFDYGQSVTHIPSMTTGVTVDYVQHKMEIQKQIDEIKKEKIPDARNTTFGRKVWQKEKDDKIANLNKLLI